MRREGRGGDKGGRGKRKRDFSFFASQGSQKQGRGTVSGNSFSWLVCTKFGVAVSRHVGQSVNKTGDCCSGRLLATLKIIMVARSLCPQIAALRTRLRLAEEDAQAARREALLEGQARSLVEVEAARKKAAQALARAEALRDRCARQVGGGAAAKEFFMLNNRARGEGVFHVRTKTWRLGIAIHASSRDA